MFRNSVMLCINDFAKCPDRVLEINVFAFQPGELCSNKEGLREETLHLACTRNNQFIFVGQFVKSKNCNNILQLLISLKHFLYVLRSVVMFITDDARIKNSR